jgi:hypothetical protein
MDSAETICRQLRPSVPTGKNVHCLFKKYQKTLFASKLLPAFTVIFKTKKGQKNFFSEYRVLGTVVSGNSRRCDWRICKHCEKSATLSVLDLRASIAMSS